MRALRFLALRRFNYIDGVFIAAAAVVLAGGDWPGAAVVLVVGGLASGLVEQIAR